MWEDHAIDKSNLIGTCAYIDMISQCSTMLDDDTNLSVQNVAVNVVLRDVSVIRSNLNLVSRTVINNVQ